jgi:hypothetical protein
MSPQVDADHEMARAQRLCKRTKVIAVKRDAVNEDAGGIARALHLTAEDDRLAEMLRLNAHRVSAGIVHAIVIGN